MSGTRSKIERPIDAVPPVHLGKKGGGGKGVSLSDSLAMPLTDVLLLYNIVKELHDGCNGVCR